MSSVFTATAPFRIDRTISELVLQYPEAPQRQPTAPVELPTGVGLRQVFKGIARTGDKIDRLEVKLRNHPGKLRTSDLAVLTAYVESITSLACEVRGPAESLISGKDAAVHGHAIDVLARQTDDLWTALRKWAASSPQPSKPARIAANDLMYALSFFVGELDRLMTLEGREAYEQQRTTLRLVKPSR